VSDPISSRPKERDAITSFLIVFVKMLAMSVYFTEELVYWNFHLNNGFLLVSLGAVSSTNTIIPWAGSRNSFIESRYIFFI
jgi:hypothetical protein